MSEKLQWKRSLPDTEVMRINNEDDVPYLTFPLLSDRTEIVHGFSTRLGGVSTGCSASMNLSEKAFDTPENVRTNFRRITASMGIDPEGMVLSRQTHTTNVRLVTEADRGKGYLRDRDYDNVDGLITNIHGITLVTHYADCVPLYFVDPVHHAIGLSHSGWRGTVHRMGRETLCAMRDAFGTDPADVLAAIGPSICKDCYEVSADVADEFKKLMEDLRAEGFRLHGEAPRESWILEDKGTGKYQLDLWETNRLILLAAGIREDHLQVTDLCTSCNKELLHSHRATGGKRGLNAAFLSLK